MKNDIALIQLNQSVCDIPPLTLYSDFDEAEHDLTFVGWGDYGNGITGVEGADGQLRTATNRIEQVDDQWLIFQFDEPPNAMQLEGISGPGDSGGPALIKTAKGLQVAGISSTQCSEAEYYQRDNWQEFEGEEGIYGVWEYYTRVSKYISCIQSTILQSSLA